MKIRPVGDELFHADGQTDMTKKMVAFRNLAKAPKKKTTTDKCCNEVNTFLVRLGPTSVSHTVNTSRFTSSEVERQSQAKSAEHSPSGAFALLSYLDITFLHVFTKHLAF
jgi:hypothetical protein